MPTADLQSLLQQARQLHAAGRFDEAERLYEQILAVQGDHADALHLLGALMGQTNRRDRAIELIRRACSLSPNVPAYWNNLGTILRDAGDAAGAVPLHRRAIALRGDYAEAMANLAVALMDLKEYEQAAGVLESALRINPSLYRAASNLGAVRRELKQLDLAEIAARHAIRLKADFSEAWGNLGVILRDLGRTDEAIAAHRRAVELDPTSMLSRNNLAATLRDAHLHEESIDECRGAIARFRFGVDAPADLAEAYVNLSGVLVDLRRHAEALHPSRQAIALNPRHGRAWANLSAALCGLQQWEEALAAADKATELAPELVEAANNRGVALGGLDRFEQAVDALNAALRLKPGNPEALNNLGNILTEQGRFEEGLRAGQEAVKADPAGASALWNLSLLLLRLGQFEQGWQAYEARLKLPHLFNDRKLPGPRWHGQPLVGKTILIEAEQGFGDMIQFSRCAAQLADRGARVILECDPVLRDLLHTAPGVTEVVDEGVLPSHFDYHIPLLSLPGELGIAADNIPSHTPYLFADEGKIRKWRDRLSSLGQSPRVGLVWAGRPSHANDRRRSVPLAAFAPLAMQGITFISLQKGPAAHEALEPPAGMQIVSFGDELLDFAESAALVCALDLVICVDTAVAHLAGALGRKVWTLLPLASDWRWRLNMENTAWYPSMKLYRQNRVGDWDGVIARVADDLKHPFNRTQPEPG